MSIRGSMFLKRFFVFNYLNLIKLKILLDSVTSPQRSSACSVFGASDACCITSGASQAGVVCWLLTIGHTAQQVLLHLRPIKWNEESAFGSRPILFQTREIFCFPRLLGTLGSRLIAGHVNCWPLDWAAFSWLRLTLHHSASFCMPVSQSVPTFKVHLGNWTTLTMDTNQSKLNKSTRCWGTRYKHQIKKVSQTQLFNVWNAQVCLRFSNNLAEIEELWDKNLINGLICLWAGQNNVCALGGCPRNNLPMRRKRKNGHKQSCLTVQNKIVAKGHEVPLKISVNCLNYLSL